MEAFGSFLFGVGGFAFLATASVWLIMVAAKKPAGRLWGTISLVCLLTSCGGLMMVGQSASTTSSSGDAVANATDAPDSPEPDETDPPTPKPRSLAEQKHDELQQADESISGSMIAGNKFKYVGDIVDLHCTVDDIPDQSLFNATCGEDSDGLPVTIVIEHDSTDLQPGQAIRAIGPVESPMEGNNAMGGEATFPTVRADFLE